MKPGQRRRTDRKWVRKQGWKRFSNHAMSRQALEEIPHPKRSFGTAYDYVSWCIDNGYSKTAFNFIDSL